ncbi:MAG: zinc metallopeptidase [Bacteroidia bacterium]|nr:zinc metallopeptidase [Bacteroidia bacterium]
MFDPVLLIITIVFAVIGFIISGTLKSKFAKYSRTPMRSGLSGKEVAEKMLRDNNVHDVKVISVEGQLTDHYNPKNRTVNLSRSVYEGRHIAAAAVAAHECGHAVQHAQSYAWLQMRSALVPVVQIGTTLLNFVIFAVMIAAFALPALSNIGLLIMIIAQALITLFTLVTLPVEIDASQRALIWLQSSRISAGEEQGQAKDALTWAGLTYLAAALGALVTLLYLVLQFTGRRDN